MTSKPGFLRSGRGYLLTLLLGLAASGAVAVGVTRTWVRAEGTVEGMPRLVAEVPGSDVSSLVGALGLACLAAFGAVVATRGWVRVVVGGLVVAAMGTVVVLTVWAGDSTALATEALAAKGWAGGAVDTQTVGWRWLVAFAAAIGAVCGAVVTRFGRDWTTMGERYDAPTEQRRSDPTSEADVWKAIDRGDDPTNDG